MCRQQQYNYLWVTACNKLNLSIIVISVNIFSTVMQMWWCDLTSFSAKLVFIISSLFSPFLFFLLTPRFSHSTPHIIPLSPPSSLPVLHCRSRCQPLFKVSLSSLFIAPVHLGLPLLAASQEPHTSGQHPNTCSPTQTNWEKRQTSIYAVHKWFNRSVCTSL